MVRWLLVLVLGACGGPDDGEEPFVPDLPAGGCGLEHAWAPMARMGEVVDWELAEAFSMGPEQIAALLDVAGVEGLPETRFGVRVYRVRYLTQDRGEIIEASGLLSYPDAQGSFPTVLWTHPTMGFSDPCGPTARGLEGAAANIMLSAQGYAVAQPDYLGMTGFGEPSGMLHPYVVPEPTAVASLDSVRALWRFAGGGLDPELRATATARVIPWGASEGGFGALWADRYASGYLPEAEIVATVAVVAPTDMLGIGRYGATYFGPASAALAAHLTTAHHWYDRDEALTEVFTEPVADAIEASLVADCSGGDALDQVEALDDLYTEAFLEAASEGRWDEVHPWSCFLEQATLDRTAIPRGHDAPVLFVVSELDDLVVAEVERASFPRLCEAYDMAYVECAGAKHVEGAALTLPYQFDWVEARLAGEPLDEICVQHAPIDCEAAFGASTD